MNRILLLIAKTMSLLAVAILPVQQTLAANCCCHEGHGYHAVADSPNNCCSQGGATCCDTTDKSLGSCCGGQSQTDSKSCRCPAGLCGLGVPTAIDLASGTTSSDEELEITTIGGFPATVTDVARRPHRESLRTSASCFSTSGFSTSGSHRCVLLCRYRL